jgi:hypothetical protein
MDKIKRIEKYLFDFFSHRFEDFEGFYRSEYENRRPHGIYKLKDGDKLMDLLHSIHDNIQEQYYFKKLIPHKFVTPNALLNSLNSFKKYLNDNQKYLDANDKGEDTSYVIQTIQRNKDELIEMIDYVIALYDKEYTEIPYQKLRYDLIIHNIPDFIENLKSILASVSYAISKSKEGFHHSNVHLILRMLGFEISPEESTNKGRIDATIRFLQKIYIVEFKFDKNKDLSKEALKQIKDKNYAQKYVIENKDIFGIGISFGEKERNINGFKDEQLYKRVTLFS